MNDDFYYQHTFSDWFYTFLVALGAVGAVAIAVVVTL
jgi:hypothetical protein